MLCSELCKSVIPSKFHQLVVEMGGGGVVKMGGGGRGVRGGEIGNREGLKRYHFESLN